MGLYIETSYKKIWLDQNGEELMFGDFTWESIKDDEFLVVLVDNSIFFAAGVAYNRNVFNAFTIETDGRPKTYYAVKKELLKTVCPQWEHWIKGK